MTVPLTQEVMAELSGAGRPTVNQVLREEEKRGTIEASTRGRTRILDASELARRAALARLCSHENSSSVAAANDAAPQRP